MDAGACSLNPCPTETLCVDISTGFRCDSRFTGLSWASPDAGQMFGAGDRLALDAVLVPDSRNDGGGFPATLTAQVPGAGARALTASTGGHYLASVDAGNVTEGPVRLFVSFDGGGYELDAGVTVTVDKTPPSLAALQVEAEPTRPAGGGWGVASGWRRDETPHVLMTSTNEDIAAATLTMEGSTAGVATATVGACTSVGLICSNSARCRCYVVDLAVPPLNAVSGSFALSATATDPAGNASAAATGSVGVTRVRWSRLVDNGSNPAIRSAPVVSKDGLVVVATSAGTGSLTALEPDGTTVTGFPLTPGPIEASLSIGVVSSKEYVAYATSNGASFTAVNLANLTDTLSNCGLSSTSYSGGLAVGLFSGTTVFVGMRDSTAGTNTRLQLLDSSTCSGVKAPAAGGNLYNVNWPAALLVAAQSNTIVVPCVDTNIRAYDGTALPPTTSDLSATNAGFPLGAGSSTGINGLALRASGTKVLGGGAGASGVAGHLFQMSVTNPSGRDFEIPGGMADAGSTGAPMIRGTTAYVGFDNLTQRIRQADVSGTPTGFNPNSFSTAGFASATPIAGDSEIYVLAPDGTASTVDTNLGLRWSFASGVSNSQAPMTLDCHRPGGGGAGDSSRPGTLYVPLGDGHLTALVVDSHKLDPTADWPKYQRDAYNSGNSNSAGQGLNPGCP